MNSENEDNEYVLLSRSAVRVYVNQAGGISIVGEDSLDEPAVIQIETQDVPKLIAALRKTAKEAKGALVE